MALTSKMDNEDIQRIIAEAVLTMKEYTDAHSDRSVSKINELESRVAELEDYIETLENDKVVDDSPQFSRYDLIDAVNKM